MGSHPVQPGEHMVRIAAEEQVASYRTLWDHASNKDLASKRKNPNILLPGDVVNLPNPAPKTEKVPTEKVSKFVAASRDQLDFRVVLLDENNQPLKGLKCQFLEEGREATSDGSGVLERLELSPRFELGVLRFDYREKVRLAFAIAVGHLDPLDTPSGIQERLSNLGYYAGEIGYADEDAVALKCAIEEFELENGLTPKGDPASATMQDKLKDVHGC
jgi:hypothetical protein